MYSVLVTPISKIEDLLKRRLREEDRSRTSKEKTQTCGH